MEKFIEKYFSESGLDANFQEWGNKSVQTVLEWLKVKENNIHPEHTLPELAQIFSEIDIPKSGSNIEKVLDEMKKDIFHNSIRINHPRFIGHMTQALPWISILSDLFVAALNQNQVKLETALASSFVEKQILCWIHRAAYQNNDKFYQKLIQDPTQSLGSMVNGGTMGNLTALTVAREKKFPGIRKEGIFKALEKSGYSGVVILGSRMMHYSIKKVASILGFGEDSVISLPTDQNNRIRLDALEAKISELKNSNIAILALIGIAGSSETGNVDSLEEMGEIAQRENIWFHVDAAWGGALLLSEKYRTKLKGINTADSITLDGHKLFWVTLVHGVVLLKDPKDLLRLKHNANYIIRKGSVDLGQTTIEGSRRFDALKLWFALKIFGLDGYKMLLDKTMSLADQMKNMIKNSPDFELTSAPETCILTYRYAPEQTYKDLKIAQYQGLKEEEKNLNLLLNKVNIEIQKRQKKTGASFVSRTLLKLTSYSVEIVVLRAILTNVLTTTEDLQKILNEQKTLGENILAELVNWHGDVPSSVS